MVDSDANEPTLELVHESLISSWPVLQRWIEADRDGVAFNDGGFAPRMEHGTVVHNGKVFIVAGWTTSTGYGSADVWSASSADTWRLGHRTVISF